MARVEILRAVGAATAAYGAAVTVWPGLLARPSRLVEADGRVGESTRTSLRPLAWRDMASGLALVLAPPGPALTTAACVRMAADFGDAVLLARTLPTRSARVGAAVVSVGWGALSVIGLAARPAAGTVRERGGAGPVRRS